MKQPVRLDLKLNYNSAAHASFSGKTTREIEEMQAEREAKARATILEMVGDIPDADIAPPENVLFVCKLNPVTTDDDLEIIFSRFGKIKSCEVIRDRKSGDSLQYAFIEFENQKSCEDAYFKMANVLIDDRRIHVDFSQSVSKVKWLGKGRVTHYDEKGNRSKNGGNREIGKGNYKMDDRKRRLSPLEDKRRRKSRSPQRSRTPKSRDNFRRDYKDSRRREFPDHRRKLDEERHLSRRTKERDGRSPRQFRSPRRRSRSRRQYSPPRSPQRRNKSRDNKHSEVVRSQSDRKPKNKHSRSTSSSEDESEKRSKHDKKSTKLDKKEVRRTKKQTTESDSSSEDDRSKKKKRTETRRRK